MLQHKPAADACHDAEVSAAHRNQGVHNIDVLRREAHVHGRRPLQRVEVPALGGHDVVDGVDVDARRCAYSEKSTKFPATNSPIKTCREDEHHT